MLERRGGAPAGGTGGVPGVGVRVVKTWMIGGLVKEGATAGVWVAAGAKGDEVGGAAGAKRGRGRGCRRRRGCLHRGHRRHLGSSQGRRRCRGCRGHLGIIQSDRPGCKPRWRLVCLSQAPGNQGEVSEM